MLINHENQHRTRYLHLTSPGLPASGGQLVARGQVIGYEGATGYTDPTGFIHLHFEVRDNASTFTCTSPKSGTAVDPYGGWWKTDPPSTARDLDFSGDGYPDVMGKETSTGTICLVRGNGAGGWNDPGDPGCGTGSPIGWGWNVYDAMFRPGDFNGDGYPDVLQRNPGSGGINEGTLCLLAGYRGDGYGYWIPDPPDPACGDGTPIGTGWNFFDKIIGPGDMNGDGFNDVLGRVKNGLPNAGDLCLLRGDGHGGWIPYTWNQTCHSGTRVGTGWNMYNSLVTPSDFGGNGDSCPDVLGRDANTPYAMRMHSGSCNTYFVEQQGVYIEGAWSAFDWLLSVGDFGGAAGAAGDICSDVLRWYGGKHYVDMRRGNCNGGFLEARVVGYEWQMYDWLF